MDFLGHVWSLDGVSGVLLYLLGFAGEVFVLASIYLVMPVGRMTLKHALIGALAAALLWELSRHALLWYFDTLSQISTVYGSLTTAIAVLLSLEVAATLLLLGAQVISEYERIGRPGAARPAAAVHHAARLKRSLRPETDRPGAPNRAAASPASPVAGRHRTRARPWPARSTSACRWPRR